jgi:hypothetical protein
MFGCYWVTRTEPLSIASGLKNNWRDGQYHLRQQVVKDNGVSTGSDSDRVAYCGTGSRAVPASDLVGLVK